MPIFYCLLYKLFTCTLVNRNNTRSVASDANLADWKSINLTSTGNSVTAETSVLSADLDTKAFKVGLGIQF